MADSPDGVAALGAANLFNVKGLVAVVTGGGTGMWESQSLSSALFSYHI